MFYFANIKNLDELKAQYRRLAMMYHPDRGGSVEIMQAINAEDVYKRQTGILYCIGPPGGALW